MKIIDLFAGIGVASLAAETVFPGIEHEFVEINPFSQTILKKHFPNSPIHDDIRNYHPTGTVDIVWGSPPCQAASAAGKRKGTADPRWLWPDYFRVIAEAKPRWTIAENVYGLLSLNNGLDFEELCLGLEALGYSVRAYIIPALAVGAPHERNRVWIVAHSLNDGNRGGRGQIRETESLQRECGEAMDSRVSGGADQNAADSTGERLEGATGEICQNGGNGFTGSSTTRYSNLTGLEGHGEDGECPGERPSWEADWKTDWREVAFRTCLRGDVDGTSRGVHRLTNGKTITSAGLRTERLKALGNSLVYPLVVKLFEAIKYADERIPPTN